MTPLPSPHIYFNGSSSLERDFDENKLKCNRLFWEKLTCVLLDYREAAAARGALVVKFRFFQSNL